MNDTNAFETIKLHDFKRIIYANPTNLNLNIGLLFYLVCTIVLLNNLNAGTQLLSHG